MTTKQEQRAREMTVSWDAGLCILLSTQEGINAFSQHCAREFSSENTDDEGEASDARDGKEDLKSEIHALASNIYDSFVLDTDHQVNLSSKHKSDIKKAIDSKQLAKDTFDAAQKEIFGVMARDSYPRYLGAKNR
ncbi:hypothetical protein ACHAWT_004754 [Skeletonema menzelii]